MLLNEARIQLKIIDEGLYGKHLLPNYATEGSVGIDLRASKEEFTHPNDADCIQHNPIVLFPGEVKLIKTGIAINMKNSYLCGVILPRSGLGHNHGIILGNGTGLIDNDYQGEIKVSLWNRSDKAHAIYIGDRIAQLIFLPIIKAQFDVVDSFTPTERGESGFGSTGK